MSISQSTPPPHLNNQSTQLVRCVACQTEGPLGKVLKCQQCHFRVHVGEPFIFRVLDTGAMSVSTGACGAVVNSPESWKCEICENEDTLEAAIVKDLIRFYYPYHFSTATTLDPRLPFVSSHHKGREETKPPRFALVIPVRPQADRGARMGARSLRGVHPRADIHRPFTAPSC